MGELPTAEGTNVRWTRWAIPVSLVAIVAVAAIYEWARPAAASRSHPVAKDVSVAAEAPPAAEKTETPLPNPLAGSAPSPVASKEDAASSSPASAQAATPSAPDSVDSKGTASAR